MINLNRDPAAEFELKKSEIIEIARKIIKEGPICDNCLGRQFAMISSGLTNKERGEIVKRILSAQGMEIEARKCWLCNDLFKKLPELASKAMEEMREYEYDSFLVGTKVSGMLSENEEMMWETSGASYAEPLKAELNREVGKIIERVTEKRVDFERPEVVVILNLWNDKVELQINSLFIYGRYRKLKRGIPQTRWICRECRGKGCERCNFSGKMCEESVEELIKWSVLDEFKGTDMVLHGCGREDIDARMLGSGRPFVAEIKEPRRRKVVLRMLEEKVKVESRGKVEVIGLQYVGKEMVKEVKNANPDKTYRIKVEVKGEIEEGDLIRAIDMLKGAMIEQRTPTRVLHRRADLVRKRKIHDVRLISFEDTLFLLSLEIRCDGGLYIKELISGDEGRTKPNLSDLLGTEAEAKAVELDVVDVNVGMNLKDDGNEF